MLISIKLINGGTNKVRGLEKNRKINKRGGRLSAPESRYGETMNRAVR